MKLKAMSLIPSMAFVAASALCSASLCVGAWGQGAPAAASSQSATERLREVTYQTSSNDGLGPAEILSDTRGVNFQPYVSEVLRTIYGQWVDLLPDEARTPTLAKGQTDIRFTIKPNGEVASMHLDANTHDGALNQAAWGAIASLKKFPPLPTAFTGPDLELRIHFRVNTTAAGGDSSTSR